MLVGGNLIRQTSFLYLNNKASCRLWWRVYVFAVSAVRICYPFVLSTKPLMFNSPPPPKEGGEAYIAITGYKTWCFIVETITQKLHPEDYHGYSK